MLIKASTDWSTAQGEKERQVPEFPSPHSPPADKLLLGISSLDMILEISQSEECDGPLYLFSLIVLLQLT